MKYRWRRIGFLLIFIACVHSVQVKLNGWHKCVLDTDNNIQAECAIASMPLCYPGRCNGNSLPSTQKVDVFLKRIRAVNNSETASNVWFIPDHPLVMSKVQVEEQLMVLYTTLNSNVNVYLMDSRGTGRGTLFNCEATQATANASVDGTQVSVSEVSSCALDLQQTFGTSFASAFSMTSIAWDIVTLISQFQANRKVFLYGVGFGTHIVQRLMHFPSNEIVGYVFDSTTTTSGATLLDFAYRSRADKDFGDVAKAWLDLCADDSNCAKRFDISSTGEHSIIKILEQLFVALDKRLNPCASLFKSTSNIPLSFSLKNILAEMLQMEEYRAFIPSVIYRLNRCESSDREVLTSFLTTLENQVKQKKENQPGADLLVHDMIQFSELWEIPTPTIDVLTSRVNESIMSTSVGLVEGPRYCAFSRDQTDACTALNLSASAAPPLVYPRDIYWNLPAKSPAGRASVLFLHARYDGEASLAYALELYDAMPVPSATKQLLVLDTATHNVLGRSNKTSKASLCARQITASFVASGGGQNHYDTSCLRDMPPASTLLQVSSEQSQQVFRVSDPYDGVIGSTTPMPVIVQPSSKLEAAIKAKEAAERSRNQYRVAFIILLVIVIILMILIGIIWLRAREERRLHMEDAALRKLREGERDSEDEDSSMASDLYEPEPSDWFYRSSRVHL